MARGLDPAAAGAPTRWGMAMGVEEVGRLRESRSASPSPDNDVFANTATTADSDGRAGRGGGGASAAGNPVPADPVLMRLAGRGGFGGPVIVVMVLAASPVLLLRRSPRADGEVCSANVCSGRIAFAQCQGSAIVLALRNRARSTDVPRFVARPPPPPPPQPDYDARRTFVAGTGPKTRFLGRDEVDRIGGRAASERPSRWGRSYAWRGPAARGCG